MKKVLALWMSLQEQARQRADGGDERIEMGDLAELIAYCRRHDKPLCFVPDEAMVGNKQTFRRYLVVVRGSACPLAVSFAGTFTGLGTQETCDGEYLIFDSALAGMRFLLAELEELERAQPAPAGG